jgi:glycosyltransferase involved in cell wall biosynthesis
VGWNQVRQAARFHEVWVLTRENNRPAIEEELARHPMPHATWHYYDLPPWLRFRKRGRWGIHLYYYLWQLGGFWPARRLHKKVHFDLVHHVTFVSYWSPSLVALLPTPFLWGPVGGGESAPKGLRATFSWRGKLFEALRSAARWCGEHDPLVRMTARRACLALATTPETALRLVRLGCRKVGQLGVTALEENDLRGLAVRVPPSGGLRLLSVGQLIHLKGYHLGLEAFARMKTRFPESTYWLIGDGPERGRLAKLADSLGLKGSVRFLGNLPREAVLRILAAGHLLLHPSLHDSGSWACLEAMAAGCPVVCFDLGGPAVHVSPESGIKVPAISRKQAVEQLGAALQRLGGDPGLRARMGEAGRRRARELFSWDRKGQLLREHYLGVLGGREGQ